MKGKQFSAQVHRNVHSGANIQCVQKRGAYVAQHKQPNIERVHAGHSWTLHFPLFSRPCPPSQPQNPWNPYFYSVSWQFRGCFDPPPPKPSTRIFSGHNKITSKVRFVNKVGALFVPPKRFWNPYFYSVSRNKIENALVVLPLPCPISIDPSRSAIPERPPNKVTTKWKHQNPHAKTRSQDMNLKNNTTTQQRRNNNPRWGR